MLRGKTEVSPCVRAAEGNSVHGKEGSSSQQSPAWTLVASQGVPAFPREARHPAGYQAGNWAIKPYKQFYLLHSQAIPSSRRRGWGLGGVKRQEHLAPTPLPHKPQSSRATGQGCQLCASSHVCIGAPCLPGVFSPLNPNLATPVCLSDSIWTGAHAFVSHPSSALREKTPAPASSADTRSAGQAASLALGPQGVAASTTRENSA